jgi:hypothetical protein
MTKQVVGAIQVDADVCNALDLPKAGAQGTRGIQIAIPPDFAARIAAGQEVPGCTYSHIEPDGSLYVSDTVQAQLAVPAVVNALPTAQKIEAPLLVTKLATAVVVAAMIQ